MIKIIPNKNLWKLFQSANRQAKSWEPASNNQKLLFSDLFNKCMELRFSIMSGTGNYQETIEEKIIEICDKLQLKVYKIVNDSDEFLMMYTKYGVSNYNGPFIMFRLTECHKIMIISPHNESDGTSIDTVIGFIESRAMWYICNGHKRANQQPERDETDFIRNKKSLGYFVIKDICEKLKGLVILHIHGSKKPGVCLTRSRSKELENTFRKSITDNTNIRVFKGFNAGYEIDKIVNTNYYLKTEIPSKTHINNKKIIRDIVLDIQKNAWAQDL